MTADEIYEDFIQAEDKGNKKSAQEIVDVSTAIMASTGSVPHNRDALKALGLDDTVVALLMTQVYASTELIVGTHARKILVALDMIDWEEVAKEKSKVKMSSLPSDKVKRSLLTWLPRGEATHFHDTMDSIGNLLQARTQGDWGRIKSTIATRFSPKDNQALLSMAESICQFYKVVRATSKPRKRPNDLCL